MSDADKFVRNLALIYEEMDYSVCIIDTQSNIYHPSRWETDNKGYNPSGILLRTSNVSIIIDTSDCVDSGVPWGDTSAEVSGAFISSDYEEALGDYNGEDNTTYIIEQLGDVAEAANAARSVTFTKSKLVGYLGSVGEWQEVLNNWDAIQEALSICGRTQLRESAYAYWTSSQSTRTNAWHVNTSDKLCGNALTKTFSQPRVRAFAKY